MPSAAARAATAPARLPVDEHESVSSPSSCAFRAATATTRSLNECVGFAVSSLSHSSRIPSSVGEPGSGHERRHPRSETCLLGSCNREQVGVAPDRLRPGLDRRATHAGTQCVPVVGRIEWAEAARTRACRVERMLGRADAAAKGNSGHWSEPPGRRSTSVRDWHRHPICGAGCRGVTGPVPQPLLMRSGTGPAPGRTLADVADATPDRSETSTSRRPITATVWPLSSTIGRW